jgi:HAD superfamily hydrolase (TIGR01484 family)
MHTEDPAHPKIVVFDLDDTLAPSKSPLPEPMSAALLMLLERLPVGIITGGRFEQIRTQILDRMPASEELLGRLHLMPTCGAQYVVRRDGRWTQVYSEDLPAAERAHIVDVLERVSRELGLWEEKPWGEPIEDRQTQLTYSALGQLAPLEAKTRWDPDGAKRRLLVAHLTPALPGLEVRSGGSTSIDVTRQGVDKAYGVGRLMTRLQLDRDDVLFVGDRLDAAGNDYPVLAAGVPCVAVADWQATLVLIRQLVEWWDGAGCAPTLRQKPQAARR